MTNPLGLNVILRALQTSAMVAATLLVATDATAENQTVSYIEDAGAAQRIDASGKLRMLSQRVVATACYVQAGIEKDATTAMLNAATDEFKLITAALEFGNADLGIHGAETHPKTLATIERLHAIWDPIAVIGENVVAGNATHEEITQMALQSEPLLEMAQRLVSAETAEYSMGASLVMRDAMAIDIAGRQRMLAQRISKDVCLLATGVDTEHSMDDLAQTAEIFEASLTALRAGMPAAGLLAPTDEHVIADLNIAAADWAIVQTKIADALSGEPIDAERLAVMFELSNTLTTDMNKVVVDYTEASKAGL
jgi:hypothetical protein